MSGRNIVRDLGYKPAISRISIGDYRLYLHHDAPCREFSSLEEVITRMRLMKRIILREKPDYVNLSNEDIKRLEKERLKIVGNGRKLIPR